MTMIEISTTKPNIINITNNNKSLNRKVLIVCSQHGDEVTPIITGYNLIELLKQLDLDHYIWKIFSNITIINGANISALRNCTRTAPIEPIDYNRAYNLTNEITTPEYIKSLVEINDLVIDVHSSESVITPFLLIDDDIYKQSLIDCCKKLNIFYSLNYTNNNNSLKSYTIHLNDLLFNQPNTRIGFLSNQKIKLGFTLELNSLQCADLNSGLIGSQIILTMLENVDTLYLSNETSLNNFSYNRYITINQEGIFIPTTNKIKLQKNDQLGIIKNLVGDQICDVNISDAGTLLILHQSKYVTCGQNIGIFQPSNLDELTIEELNC